MAFPQISQKNCWSKKAQIEVTFNWIYVLIAGAVILLFFALIIVQQKSQSEENLASDVIRIMSSILSGAGISENTKNTIDTSGIADYTLYFSCDEGVGEVGVVGKGSPVQNAIDPIFAPAEIKTAKLITWSLPFKFPYKVMDLLMVTSLNTEYVVVGDGSFADEFVENTKNFTVKRVNNLDEVNSGVFYQIRVVDVDGKIYRGQLSLSGLGSSLADYKVTAISFVSPQQVIYYQKNGNQWEALHSTPIQLLSFSAENDPAKYAAIFAGNDQLYECNMGKVMKRLEFVSSIYSGKSAEMEEYHNLLQNKVRNSVCADQISGSVRVPLNQALTTHTTNIHRCLGLGYNTCVSSILDSATAIANLNNNLESNNCITLY